MAADRRELTDAYKQNPPPMGVFRIRHLPSGRVFIASGRNLRGIMNSHQFQLRGGSHPNKALQADWNRDGASAFAVELLDELPALDATGRDARAELAELEALWLEKLQPYGERGYNAPPRRADGNPPDLGRG